MGYHTDFSGEFDLDKPLSPVHLAYLKAFNNTRRMKRDGHMFPADPVRVAVGLPLGPDGAYFVGGLGFKGQDRDESIQDFNRSPAGQPSLWCQWTPREDGKAIVWDGGEKFYEYIRWIQYLIEHFLQPWGYVVNGTVEWEGEDNDLGKIVVEKNHVRILRGKIIYNGR